jgi:hypothetical protein
VLIVNRYLVVTTAVALAGAAVLMSSPAGASPVAGVTAAGGGWAKAEEVPGTASLNTGGSAQIASVSCPSAGNCSAGGSYLGSGGTEPFVVSQVRGVWGNAEEVPGSAALNKGGSAGEEDTKVEAVSCASAGHCSAGGDYTHGSGGVTDHQQAFVVSRT